MSSAMSQTETSASASASLPRPGRNYLSTSIVTGLTGLVDIAVVLGLGYVIYVGYLPLAERKPDLYLAAVTIYTTLAVLSFNLAGLYRFGTILRPASQIGRISAICLMVFLFLIALGFALKVTIEFSRVWAFSWVVSSATGLTISRFWVARLLLRFARQGQITRNIIIYGAGEPGERLVRYIDNLNEPWNRITAVFDERATRVAESCHGHKVQDGLDALVAYARMHRTDEILIALPWSSPDRVYQVMRALLPLPAIVRVSPELASLDLMSHKVSNQYGIPMLTLTEKPVSGWSALSKTIFDYVLAVMLLVPALPVMAIIAACIKLESRGPVFFRQDRQGFNHDMIKVWKFRTMYADQCDVTADALTTRDDPRVTRVGAVLRRLSLDELPQLFNVLRGEMSVVGPRPHALEAKAGGRLYDQVVDGYAIRHKVKPGITGWAQVNGWRGNTETEDDLHHRVEHDLYYIDNWSVAFDLYIVARTVGSVLSGKNSY
jgi:Undecaprenyl-phosphate glucose phosphotransferase